MSPNEGDNKIIVALDIDDIKEGIYLVEQIEKCTEIADMIYGYKIGSIWVLERGLEIVEELFNSIIGDHRIVLDMQKWPVDIPDMVIKQVEKASDTCCIDEIIACPMGGGRKSLEVFVRESIKYGMRPLCVLEMTHPESDSYLRPDAWRDILSDAASFGIDGFIIPATKPPKYEIKEYLDKNFHKLNVEFYSMGFEAQQGQTGPMRQFGVNKFIVGRGIYETEYPIQAIKDIYEEINRK